MRFKTSSTGAPADTGAEDKPAETEAKKPADATSDSSPKPPVPEIATTIGTIAAEDVDAVHTAHFAGHEVPTASVPVEDSMSDIPESVPEATSKAALALSVLGGLLVGFVLGLAVQHLLLSSARRDPSSTFDPGPQRPQTKGFPMNTRMRRPLSRRIGALTCAGALCLGMLGGCSGDSDSSGSAASASSSATSTTEGTEAPAKNDAKDDAKDLTDEEILDRIIEANGSFTDLDHPVRQVTTTSMDFGADSGLGTIESEVTMETGVDPIRFRHVTKSSAASLDEAQETVRWGEVQEDGSISVWSPGTDGGWEHQVTSAEDAQTLLDSSSTASQLRSVLESNADSVTLTRKGDSYYLKMDIPHDKVMELLGESIEQMAMGGEVTFKNYTIEATFDAETFYETEMKNDFSFDFDLQGQKNSLTAKSTTTIDHNPKDLDVTIPDEVRSAA